MMLESSGYDVIKERLWYPLVADRRGHGVQACFQGVGKV
jgi:hypothetical protein